MVEGNVAHVNSHHRKNPEEESDEEEWNVQASFAAVEWEDEGTAFTSTIEEVPQQGSTNAC